MCRRSAETTVGRLMTENVNQMEATQKRSGLFSSVAMTPKAEQPESHRILESMTILLWSAFPPSDR